MMRTAASLLVIATIIAAAGAAPQSPFRIVATVQELMIAFTVPHSEVIFGAAADTPKDDAGWQNVQNSALILAESSNLLLLPGRAPDNEEWASQSEKMIDAAILAATAAREKKADVLADASDKLYDTCAGCHEKYMDKNR